MVRLDLSSVKEHFSYVNILIFVIVFLAVSLAINWSLVSGYFMIEYCTGDCTGFIERQARILLYPQLFVIPVLTGVVSSWIYSKT